MVAGSRITANSICILRGSMIVPRSSPSEAVSSEAASRMNTNRAQLVTCTWGAWPEACTSSTIGNTMQAPMKDWIAPATIFWIASTRIGTGASARSSIVRCQENSITSGNVTAMIPCMSSMEAIRPGTRMVAKLMLPVVWAPAADLREHVGEDEDEQQRLHHRAGEGGDGVAPQHPELASHHRVERPQQRGARERRR